MSLVSVCSVDRLVQDVFLDAEAGGVVRLLFRVGGCVNAAASL